MQTEFRRIAALRGLMMRGDPRALPDFGRAAAAGWIARHAPALHEGVSVTPLAEGPGRVFTPDGAEPGAALVFIHGGGLVYYDSAVFTPFLAGLSARLGRVIIAPDYPKAPETPAPQIASHLRSTLARLRAARPGWRFQLAGDSVGGLLALQMALDWAAEGAGAEALHLIYPVAGRSTDPADPHGQGHFLDTTMMDWFQGFIAPLIPDAAPVDLPCARLSALPPSTVHLAECDILAPAASRLADRLAQAGRLRAAVTHHGLPHDFCLFEGASPGARAAVGRITGLMAAGCPA